MPDTGELRTASVRCHCCSHEVVILECAVRGFQELFKRTRDLLAAKAILPLEDSDRFGRDDPVDPGGIVARAATGAVISRLTLLRRVVSSEQTHEDVRVDADHRSDSSPCSSPSAIASSISSSVAGFPAYGSSQQT